MVLITMITLYNHTVKITIEQCEYARLCIKSINSLEVFS